MNPSSLKGTTLYDQFGRPVSPANKLKNNDSKRAMGLYGNAYTWQNAGKYRQRYYTLQDTSQGLDTLSRQLLCRWSREMYGQLPIIKAAVRILADFAIGNAYLPLYSGKNKDWWKHAQEWLMDAWYPNCNVRGSHYDFQTSLRVESQLIDIDGDYLLVFGSEDGFPKYQVIQNNRIETDKDNQLIAEGPMTGTIASDGVFYTPSGKAVGYNIKNGHNLVNNSATQTKDIIFSAKDATLVLDPEYVDKLRGVPAIGSAILQALSIQELDQYLMEKIKIEACVSLIVKDSRGQAPVEYQNTLEELRNIGNATGLIAGNLSPNLHGVQIVQGGDIRYVASDDGSEIKTLASNSPAGESQQYMERLETQVLSTIGVPHTLVYSTDKAGGRITSSIAEIFRASIKRRQSLLDKSAKLRVTWALIKAMEAGDIPENDENISKTIEFTKPERFSLDARYDNDIVTSNYQSGFSTLNDVTKTLYNKSASSILEEQEQEQIEFYTRAKNVADKTGVDLTTVIGGWKQNLKLTRPPEAIDPTPNNKDSVDNAI